MQDDSNDTIENEILTDQDIFTQIWTSPRLVFQYINNHHYDKYVTVLLILSGIGRTFDRAMSRNMGDKMSLVIIIGICLIMGGLFGWLSYYIYAALLSWTGKTFLDGRGNTSSILRMIAYAMIPSAFSLIFLIPPIAVYGVELFKKDGDLTLTDSITELIAYTSLALIFILGIWSVVLSIIGLSEVQKFSIGKSILNLVLPGIMILVPLLAVVLLLDIFQ